jgi:hypothetical protein
MLLEDLHVVLLLVGDHDTIAAVIRMHLRYACKERPQLNREILNSLRLILSTRRGAVESCHDGQQVQLETAEATATLTSLV